MENHPSTHTLSGQIELHTGVKSARCYQCGKCSAGCPLANEMEFTPSATMRMLQLEDEAADKELLRSPGIWLCLSCEMCISRCPMTIDIPKVMDYLRQKSLEAGVQPAGKTKNIVSFHQSFLDMIRRTGRSYEIGLVVDYKMRSLNLFQDVSLAPQMLKRGKLPLLPETIKGMKEMSRIFTKSRKK